MVSYESDFINITLLYHANDPLADDIYCQHATFNSLPLCPSHKWRGPGLWEGAGVKLKPHEWLYCLR